MEKILIQHIKNTGEFYFYEDREYFENKAVASEFLKRVTLGIAENTKTLTSSVKNDFPLSYGKESLTSLLVPVFADLSDGYFISNYDLMRNSRNKAESKEGLKETTVDYYLNYRKCDIYIEHLHSTVNITTASVNAPVVKQWNEATDYIEKIKGLCRTTTTTSVKKERVLRMVIMTATGVLLQKDIAKYSSIDEAVLEKIRNNYVAGLKNPPNFCGGWIVDSSMISQEEYFQKGETYPVVLILGSVIY